MLYNILNQNKGVRMNGIMIPRHHIVIKRGGGFKISFGSLELLVSKQKVYILKDPITEVENNAILVISDIWDKILDKPSGVTVRHAARLLNARLCLYTDKLKEFAKRDGVNIINNNYIYVKEYK